MSYFEKTKITDGTDDLSINGSGQAQVEVAASLPAGDNNIGNVDVVSMPTTNVAQSGTWNINNVSGTVSLPTGAATSAKQDTGNTSLSSIDGKLATAKTADYDTGAGTDTVQMTGIALPASGGAVAGGTSTNPIQVSLANTGANSTAVKTDGSAVTQPISASSLPLPTGAATAAKQPALGTAGTASSDVITIQGIASMTPVKVDGSGVTQPVSGSVTVTQATGTNLHAVIDSGTVSTITNVVHVDDNSGSLTVDNGGTFAVQQTTATIPTATVMQNAATANGNGTSLNVSGYATAVLNITASVAMSGGTTINFEASVDDTTWVSIYGDPTGSLASPAVSTTTTGDWTFAVSGYKSLRARISAYSAGTITVKGYTTVASDTPLAVVSNLALNGTAVDGNSGNKSAGTVRVVLATDQPQLTNKLLVTPDANSSVNVSQVGGNSISAGNGVSGTGVQRVTIASDSTGNIATIGTSVTPGTSAAHLGKAEDAAHASGDTGVMSLGVRKATLADLSAGATDGDYEPYQVNRDGAMWVVGAAGPTGGWSVATGSIAATKTDIGTANTAGQVGGWYFYNPNASVAYVQFFNAQASAVTLGTTAPVYSLGIPATSAANIQPGMVGIAHSTAISIAVTTTRAGSTGPGSTVDYNVFYKQ